MASLFDQYEQASSRRPVGGMQSKPMKVQQPISTGYVNARQEDETPIFNKQRVNFNPPDPISHLCVCNNFLVMAMTSNVLLRMDLDHPDSPDEVELPRPVDDRIYKMVLDPTGRHLVISMQSTENYYLSRNSKKPKALAKLKGHKISAVGWNRQNTSDSSTGEILIGTSQGLIFETEIVSSEDSRFINSNRLVQYLKQLYSLNQAGDKVYPITGLEVEKMPSTSLTEYRYFIMATLPGRLYQFIGSIPTSTEPPMFQHIFSTYENIPEHFLELPGNFGHSDLKFYHPKFRALPSSFAWMTGPGLYVGDIDGSGAAGDQSVTVKTRLIGYPVEDGEHSVPPTGIVLTEFHVLILYPDRVKALCVLNEQPVLVDVTSERFGPLIGLCKDPLHGTIWAYSSRAVFKYKIVREARDVWQIYLDQGQFDKALLYCSDNPAHVDQVLTKQAQQLFKDKKYVESAEIYARTQASFEEVCLRFISLEESEALKNFLRLKIASLKAQDKTQLTMLVIWVTELFLNQLGRLKEQGQDISQRYDDLQNSFQKFLAGPRVKECVNENKAMVYDLISSHGNVEDMVFFAILMKDYERVITHHIQHENYQGALRELVTKQTDIELLYKFSPVLMQHVPHDTVSAWMAKRGALEPKRLIPALVQYDQGAAQNNEAIRYLEFCIQALGVKDQAIHNYLLSLYCRVQPDKLMTYLNLQGQELEQVCYDVEYALRLCAEHSHKRACVHIYSTMALYEEAVDLALQVDVDLAMQNANKPEDDEELHKKLWLKIARHVVEKEKDIRRAMDFLTQCDLLKIEDILPFFPDFVTIDHFKDAICTSLQQYNQHIEGLKEEMEESTQNAREIRGEIHSFRNKFAYVKAGDKCCICSLPLLTRSFYVFPCLHMFHSDCLVAEVLPQLDEQRRNKVDHLQRQLASRDTSPVPTHSLTTHRSTAKEELDEMVAAECIYCGEMMIRSIDQPFIGPDIYDEVMSSWT